MFGIRFFQYLGIAMVAYGLTSLMPAIGMDTIHFVSALIGVLTFAVGLSMEGRVGGYISHIGTGRGGGR